MGACPPLGMRLQKFLATYLMLLPEEEKGKFPFHLFFFFFFILRSQIKTTDPFSISRVCICHSFSTLLEGKEVVVLILTVEFPLLKREFLKDFEGLL